LEEPVSLGEWMLTMLVMCIPLVNIIMTFVWAFSSSAKKSKSNYFKASLIWALIGIAVTIVMCVLMFMHPIYW
jgi:heme/copper-type cytochrome/quinol oxidase subunit 2